MGAAVCKQILNIYQFFGKGPSRYDIRWLGGLVGSRNSEKIGYRRVGRSEEIGYPIFLGNFTLNFAEKLKISHDNFFLRQKKS